MEKSITVQTTAESAVQVSAFVEEQLSLTTCPQKTVTQVLIAVDELYSNVIKYAYGADIGTATIQVITDENRIKLIFTDRGMPFNPLAKKDPDITKPAEEREAGGLGIFMTKKFMDSIEYAYRDGANILTIEKMF